MQKQENGRSQIYQVKLETRDSNDVRIIAYNLISPNSKVLDIGCACGDFGVLMHAHKKCEMHGMEYDKKSIQIARQTLAYVDIHQVDLNIFQEDSYSEYLGYFDYITLLDVLEHLVNPQDVLPKLARYLKADGFFIISLPNVAFGDIKLRLLNDDFSYAQLGILDETHLRFFTYKTIADLLSKQFFEISETAIKVADISYCEGKVPTSVMQHIKNDPHSFVYQYVLKVRADCQDKATVAKTNLNKMQVAGSQLGGLKKIRQQLFVNKTLMLVDRILPPGSSGRNFAKKVRALIKK